MNCNQCEKCFNTHTRTPKLLPSCGHTICSSCLDKLSATTYDTFKCPFDNISYPKTQTFNDNLYVLSLLKSDTTVDKEIEEAEVLCRVHQRPEDIFCYNCKMEICSDCILFGEHRNHEYDQLDIAKSKNKGVLDGYLQHFEGLQERANKEKVVRNLMDVRTEKIKKINMEFDSLQQELEEKRNEAIGTVVRTYDSYTKSVNNVNKRVEEILTNIKSALSTSDFNSFFKLEEKLSEEIKQIDKFLVNDIFKGKTEIDQKLTLYFNGEVKAKIEEFCTVEKSKTKKESSKKDNEENLLHESFHDLIKNADSIINAHDKEMISDFVEKHQSTPSNNYLKYVQTKGNYSPISNFSNFSTIKMNNRGKGDEKNMLSKKKHSTNSLISNYSNNNPMTTTKKPKSLFNCSQNLSNLSKITKNSASPSPFKSSLQGKIKSSNFIEKENKQQLINKKEPTGHMAKINAAITKVENLRSNCLDLSEMSVTDKNMEIVGKSIARLSKLKTVKLNGNSISEIGLKYLLKNVKEGAIEYLFINNNQLKDTALDYLISFRKYNAKLKAVYMSNNPLNKTSRRLNIKIRLLEENNIIVVV